MKYIKTESNQIIIFSGGIQHKEFKNFKPVSAGMISIGTINGELLVSCYGESVSLGLNSHPHDHILAKNQINYKF